LSVDEANSGTSDYVLQVAVADVVDEWGRHIGDPNHDGAVNAFGHNALREGQAERDCHAAGHHIAEEAVGTANAVAGESEEGAHFDRTSVSDSESVGRSDPKVATSRDEATCYG